MKHGTQLRDEGIEVVLDNAGDWKTDAIANLQQWLRWKKEGGAIETTMEQFKIDLHLFMPNLAPHHPNCWGALTRSAALSGLIKPTDRSVKMTLTNAHARYAKVWEIV